MNLPFEWPKIGIWTGKIQLQILPEVALSYVRAHLIIPRMNNLVIHNAWHAITMDYPAGSNLSTCTKGSYAWII